MQVNADSRVVWNIELPDAGDEVSDIFELLLLQSAIEHVLIFIMSFPPLVNDALDWCFGRSEVLDCSETDFKVLFLPS
jgi:hypothetical protein